MREAHEGQPAGAADATLPKVPRNFAAHEIREASAPTGWDAGADCTANCRAARRTDG